MDDLQRRNHGRRAGEPPGMNHPGSLSRREPYRARPATAFLPPRLLIRSGSSPLMRKSLYHNRGPMMTGKERVDLLFEALCYRRPVRLRDAARMLSVSEMTVRRDIAASTGRLVCLG